MWDQQIAYTFKFVYEYHYVCIRTRKGNLWIMTWKEEIAPSCTVYSSTGITQNETLLYKKQDAYAKRSKLKINNQTLLQIA